MFNLFNYFDYEMDVYTEVLDILREYERIEVFNAEESFFFDYKFKELNKNKHYLDRKIRVLYRDLEIEVNNYKRGNGNKERLLESFETLMKEIVNKIKRLRFFEFLSKVILAVLLCIIVILLIENIDIYGHLIINYLSGFSVLGVLDFMPLIMSGTIAFATSMYVYLFFISLKEKKIKEGKDEIRHKLEKVYSPIEELIRLLIFNLNDKEIHNRYNAYVDFSHNFLKIKNNFFYIIISDEIMILFLDKLKITFDNNSLENDEIDDMNYVAFKFLEYIQFKIKEFNIELSGKEPTRVWENDAEYNTKIELHFSTGYKRVRKKTTKEKICDNIKEKMSKDNT
ncbi:hypothetical protein KAU33_04115 [Candidatus Dependentiae bacterium]|nr:hypothetical protein [Candidatus Dependentiae bacterium]